MWCHRIGHDKCRAMACIHHCSTDFCWNSAIVMASRPAEVKKEDKAMKRSAVAEGGIWRNDAKQIVSATDAVCKTARVSLRDNRSAAGVWWSGGICAKFYGTSRVPLFSQERSLCAVTFFVVWEEKLLRIYNWKKIQLTTGSSLLTPCRNVAARSAVRRSNRKLRH